jgi:hypothetical protein
MVNRYGRERRLFRDNCRPTDWHVKREAESKHPMAGLVAVCVVFALMFGLSRLQHRPQPVVPSEDLRITTGTIDWVEDASDFDNRVYGYRIQLLGSESDPCQVHFAVRDWKPPTAPLLTTATPVRAWVDARASGEDQWVWQLEADGRLLRSYADAVQLRQELNGKADAGWPATVLSIVLIAAGCCGVEPAG